MSTTQQIAAGIVAIVLIVIYSIIMTSSDGAAASWAWVLLVAVFVLLAWTARSVAIARSERGRD
jgi:hypothetical protein